MFQDRALAVQQTIVRNIFMGREITTFGGLLDVKKERSEAERLMREIGFTSKVFSPDSIVGQLSGGERQGVAIARAIYNNADLIILDEPTTALSLTETEKVFRFVRTVRRAAARSSSSATTSTTSSTSPSALSCSTAAGWRSRSARPRSAPPTG